MTSILPAYLEKINWAEQHLLKLEEIVGAFERAQTYTVTHTVEDKKDRFRLTFTSQPDWRVSLVAGDFLYNLRGGLDYLIGAIVRPSERTHVMLPMLHEPVWQIPWSEGENQELTDARQRWETVTRHMNPKAVAVLQELQPLYSRAQGDQLHLIDVLNNLSNKDRHQKLPVIAHGLRESSMTFHLANGSVCPTAIVNPAVALEDGAEIEVPEGTVKVEVIGTPVLVIQRGHDGRHVRVPHHLRAMLDYARGEIVPKLAPYEHRA